MECKCVWKDIETLYDAPPCPHPFDNIGQHLQDTELLAKKCKQSATGRVCERLKQYHEMTTILQSVLDITVTIVKIMESVCIHQCKCQKAMDVIIYAFLHFDEFADRPCGHNRKQIRKDDFQCDLRRDCCFTRQETKITYAITKYAFQAFYYKQIVTRFDDSFIDESVWLKAARKTIKAYKLLSGVDTTSISTFSINVNCAYKNYLDRRNDKVNELRSKYECCCNQNRSSKPSWLHQLCDPGKQPCSGIKTGQEFTNKDCTCVCDGTDGKNGKNGGRGKSTDGTSRLVNEGSSKYKVKYPDDLTGDMKRSGSENFSSKGKDDEGKRTGILKEFDCMKLKTCEEQLKCVQDKLLNIEKEKENWEAEITKIKEKADEVKAHADAFDDLVKKLGPDYDPGKLVKHIKKLHERTEFSVYLKFFQKGKNCQIDLTGIGLGKEFITKVTDLKITNDTNDRPANFRCVQT